MSKFESQPKVVTAADRLNNDLARADKEARRSLQTWMQNVELFWQAPVSHADNSLSMEEVQAKIDADPAAAQILLSASVAHIQYHMASDPALVAEMVPARFLLDGAYVWGEGLTLVSLRPEWDVQPEDN